MAPHIFVDENIPYAAGILSEKAEVTPFDGRGLTAEMLIEGGCEVLIVRSVTRLNRDLLEGTNVRFAGTVTSGSDHFDRAFMDASGIHAADAAGCNSTSVAEYAAFGILHWASLGSYDLENKTIGIIGFGHIGRKTASIAHRLGMKVLVNDPLLADARYAFPSYTEYIELDSLVSASDILTNHVPLITAGKYHTRGLIGADLLAKFRHGGLIIHASRGGVIDELALLAGLEQDRFSAITDVWENEPVFNVALAEKCLIATPHVAGHTVDGKLKGVKIILDKLGAYLGIGFDTGIIERILNEPSEEIADGEEKLYSRLGRTRRIEEDDMLMRKGFSLPDAERGAYFDKMRKDYPERRETLFRDEFP